MKIILIEHGSLLYEEAVALRYEVLRRPLGLTYSAEQLRAEAGSLHVAAYEGERLLGYLNLLPQPERALKMRQVAVSPALQRGGVGTALIAYAEALARREGYAVITLSARESAVPFYVRLGYVIEGERFEEVTLPHFKMYKALGAALLDGEGFEGA